MTRDRVSYRSLGLVAAVVATVMSPPNALSQTAMLQGAAGNTCTYTSINITQPPTGTLVTVVCGVVSPTDPGQIGFTSSLYPPVGKDAAADKPFSVFVQRLGGSAGVVDGTVAVASASANICTLGTGAGAVHFDNGVTQPVTINLLGKAIGQCNLTFALATSSVGTSGTIGTMVEVKDAAALPAPPPGCEALTPTANFLQMTTFGPAGQGTNFTGTLGNIYSWPLPKNASAVQVASAIITHTQHTSTTSPSELSLEWSISKCPGDFAYYKTTEASWTARSGITYPCGGKFGIESGGLKFNATGAADTCKVVVTTQPVWYINLRYIGGTANCPSGRCDVTYSWF